MTDVHFVNGYSQTVSVMVAFFSPGCDADDDTPFGSWGTRGWWNISPGDSAYVLDTNDRYFGYYAESVDGLVWTGDGGPAYVHQTAFDSCLSIGDDNPETRIVGLRQLDLDVNNWWRLVQ
jgi:hypothetical protein